MKRLALNLVLFSLAMIGAEARAECLSIVYPVWNSPDYNYPSSMTYDTSVGVTMAMKRSFGYQNSSYVARLPKLVGGQPNPDFDRVYGLLLKTFLPHQISMICVAGTVTSGATLDITALTINDGLNAVPVTVVNQPKVSVCDGITANPRCATVNSSYQLETSK